jgi:hypothetical protein
MIRVLFLILILVILFVCNQNEQFNEEDEKICNTIPEGECNSKLCPSNCKIQHSEKSDKCYCIARK